MCCKVWRSWALNTFVYVALYGPRCTIILARSNWVEGSDATIISLPRIWQQDALKLKHIIQPGSTAPSYFSTCPCTASAASCLMHWMAAVASSRISKYQKGGTVSGCSFLPRVLKKWWRYCTGLFIFYIGFINKSLKIRPWGHHIHTVKVYLFLMDVYLVSKSLL